MLLKLDADYKQCRPKVLSIKQLSRLRENLQLFLATFKMTEYNLEK